MWKVASLLTLSAMLVGCGTFVRSSTSEVSYDYSDYFSYDKPFGMAPEYAASSVVAAPAPAASEQIQEGRATGAVETAVKQ